jgi:hypothetical protein
VLQNEFIKFSECYLKELSFLVDGYRHSLVFDIQVEKSEEGVDLNCLKAVRYFDSKDQLIGTRTLDLLPHLKKSYITNGVDNPRFNALHKLGQHLESASKMSIDCL